MMPKHFKTLSEFLSWLQKRDPSSSGREQICLGQLRSLEGYVCAIFEGKPSDVQKELNSWVEGQLARFRMFRVWNSLSDTLDQCEKYFLESPQAKHETQKMTLREPVEEACDDCGREALQLAMDALMPPSRCSLDRAASRRNKCRM